MDLSEIKRVIAQKLGGTEARETVEAFERLAMGAAENAFEKVIDGLLESKLPGFLGPLGGLATKAVGVGLDKLEDAAVSGTDKLLRSLSGDVQQTKEEQIANLRIIAAGPGLPAIAAKAVLAHLENPAVPAPAGS